MRIIKTVKTWNGFPLMICSVCGYSAVDEVIFAKHVRISGHIQKVDEPESVIELEPVLEVETPERTPKKKRSKSVENTEEPIESESEEVKE